ncbi:ecotin family protein [Burkholderia vietnamiensis]|uniref:ecotin family protein n=2 Tax=Burkholderia vietnamiensis TaxID=60552 RepID=UPI0038559071
METVAPQIRQRADTVAAGANIANERSAVRDLCISSVVYVPEGFEVRYRVWHAAEDVGQAGMQ